jgi:tRNA (pseudouridine54-N1)-methyltransferase
MTQIIYYSKTAVTAGNFIQRDMKQAGRLDIVLNVILQTLFVSNEMRDGVKLHLIFDGPPNAPRHLLLESNPDMPISKKDIAGLIKRMLYKSPDKEGLKEIFPGCSIEKKSLEALIKELSEENDILVLDEKGEDIRDVQIKPNQVFVLGDHEGFPKDKQKFLKRYSKISVGPKVLFASQVVTLIHNECDRQI